MSLNSDISQARGSANIFKGIVLDNLSQDSPSYEAKKKEYETLELKVSVLRAYRNANPIRHIKYDKPWSREFFGHFPGSYEFCDVLEAWIDANDHLLCCLAQRKNGQQFFAIPKYGHFGMCNEHDLSIPIELWPHYRKEYEKFIQRTCTR